MDAKDRSGHTALNWAAMRDRPEVVKALLRKGADVNTQDNRGVSPLLYAAGTQNAGIVRMLVDHGADLEVESRDNMMTPMLLAIEHHDIEILDVLLAQGANVTTSKDQKGRSVRPDLVGIGS